ncbi:B3 domain-containing protein At2g31720-like [Prunus avium]|uniref:B3 domain-containing protein At2g31720-like n=1 Tax=Prunus avium TaxID=42229 RepID=A0A6P5U5I6_PRUAV|nr:B3 domain-containing protein At2g31720-like [Prunus avium]
MGVMGKMKIIDFGVDGFPSNSLNLESYEVDVKHWKEDVEKKAMAIKKEKRASASSSSSSTLSSLELLADVATRQSKELLLDEKTVVEELINFFARKGREQRVLAGKLGFELNDIFIPKKKRSRLGPLSLKRKREYSDDHNCFGSDNLLHNNNNNNNLNQKKKKQKRVHVQTEQLEPKPELPQELKHKISGIGGDVKLVIQKKICASDMSANNARFSIPGIKGKSRDFLKEKEQSDLDIRDTDKKKRLIGIPVLMLNPSDLSFDSLRLKKWQMGGNHVYNLVSGWRKVAKANKLEEDEMVQLWSFRLNHDSQLCFVLVKVNSTTTTTTTTKEEAHQHIGSTSCLSNEQLS